MKIIPFDQIGPSSWDDFCTASDDAWFRHTSTWINYTLNMSFEKGSTQNLSFGLMEFDKLIAIVPLIKQRGYSHSEGYTFRCAGFNTPFPAFCNSLGEKQRKKVTKQVFLEIDRLAKANQIDCTLFEISSLVPRVRQGYYAVNPMPRLGFNDTQIASHIVDLKIPETRLLAQCSKGHRSDIHFAMKTDAFVKVLDSQTVTEKDFMSYRTIHRQAAGRQTRPDKTWEIMYEWIKRDLSVLALYFVDNDRCIAALLSSVYKDGAYAQSDCTLPEYKKQKGIMHSLFWESMKFVKKKGFQWYETGFQYTPALSQTVPTQKEINIALFKRGFGGRRVPYYRGEKFYNYNYMEAMLKERVQKLKELHKDVTFK